MAGSAGHITDLTLNDHACLTFGEPEELFDLTAAFVRDGLTDGLKVVWLTGAGPDRVTSELSRRGIEAGPALAAGQLASEPEGRLLSDAAFDASSAIGWPSDQIAACRQAGFPGLRVAVDMSWALRPIAGVEQLPDFEKEIALAVADTAVSVLCQLVRDRRHRGVHPRAARGAPAVPSRPAAPRRLRPAGCHRPAGPRLGSPVHPRIRRPPGRPGGRMIVAGLPGHLRQRLLTADLPRRFTLAESVDDAKATFNPPAWPVAAGAAKSPGREVDYRPARAEGDLAITDQTGGAP